MPGKKPSGARSLALELIKRVEKDQAFLDRLIDSFQNKSNLKEVDRRLLSELAYGTIRHRRFLDFYLEQVLDRGINQTDLTTRSILRLGAYQLFFLDRVPARAAVNESVELSAKHARPIINAVLRKLSERRDSLKSPDDLSDKTARLGVKYSHPDWMVDLFIRRFGEGEAELLLAANNQRPETTLRVNTLRNSREELLELFEKHGVESAAGQYSPLAIRLKGRQYPGLLPGYKEGLFAVQDEASQVVVLMLSPKAGENVLDACAAPGTKSLEIFQFMDKKGLLVSADINGARLSLARKEAGRLGLEGFETLVQDLTEPLKLKEKLPDGFDRILVDAPCTGLGTIRHHPEIKWHRTPEDVPKLAELQKKLLKNLSRRLAPAGVLVYSTCTATSEENEQVISALTSEGEFQIDDPAPHLPQSALPMIRNKVLQTLPDKHGTDGFTAFRLLKRTNKI